jgi:hypothetical protein
MAPNIGSAITGLTSFNVNTLMPDLSDNADIQEALRLYHYGAPSGTNPTTQYDPTNTNPANLKFGSVAHALYSLQTQITNVSGSLGVQASAWTSKGALISASAASTVQVLTLPSQSTANDGFVLTINYNGTTTGLNWEAPLVTPTNTVTFTNKTLTAPRITASSFIADTNGNSLISFPALVTSPVNQITVTNAATTAKPTISATGTDTNITLNLVSKGTGTIQANGLDITTISGNQTLTNKTLTSPTINAPTVNNLYLSDSVVVFEGSVADAFETTLGVINPTDARTINLPNVSGTVITSGNLSDITTVGTVTSGTFPAANISGTTLNSGVVTSSLTTVGTLGSLAVTNNISAGGNVISHIAFNTTPTGSYTLVTSDDGKIVEMPSGTLTVPADGGTFVVPNGTQITILQTTTNQITIAGSGATVNATPGLKLRAQWSSCTLVKRSGNLWVAMGDLVA